MNRLLLNKLPRLIREVYNSPLPGKKKNDTICRLIAESMNASNCSIFHYSAVYDDLISIGCYQNVDHIRVEFKNDPLYREIFKNVNVYDFLSFISQKSRFQSLPDYRSFRSNQLFKSNISEEEYNRCIHYWQDDKFRKKYSYGTQTLRHQRISLDYRNTSSDIYKETNERIRNNEFYSNISILINKVKDDDLNSFADGHVTTRAIRAIEEEQCIELPLIGNRRCFGLIRIFIEKKAKEEAIQNQFNLSSLAALVSSLYGTPKPSNILQKITLEAIANHDVNYSSICGEIARKINCHACIIRMADPKTNENAIVGHTKNMTGYVNEIRKITDHIKHDYFDKIFNLNDVKWMVQAESPYKINETKLIAISFSTAESPINYYYTYQGSNIRETDTWSDLTIQNREPDLHEIFKDRIELLLKYKWNRVVIIPIPHIKSAYITLGNTDNRTFNNDDIKEVYEVLETIGLGINSMIYKNIVTSHEQEIEEFKLKRRLTHDLLSYINQANSGIKSLNAREIASLSPKIKEILEQFQKAYQIANDMNMGPDEKHEYNIATVLEDIQTLYKKQFYDMKGLQLEFSIQRDLHVRTNRDILRWIAYELLKNALKYSFPLHKLRDEVNSKIKRTWPLDRNIHSSDKQKNFGVVFIKISDSPKHENYYRFSITNAGPPLANTFENLIREGVRGEHPAVQDQPGTGLGLGAINSLVKSRKGFLGYIASSESFIHTIYFDLPK